MDILVPESQVPVLAQADLLVCGGGCAGVDMAQVPLPALQSALRNDGVYLEDVPPAPVAARRPPAKGGGRLDTHK